MSPTLSSKVLRPVILNPDW